MVEFIRDGPFRLCRALASSVARNSDEETAAGFLMPCKRVWGFKILGGQKQATRPVTADMTGIICDRQAAPEKLIQNPVPPTQRHLPV